MIKTYLELIRLPTFKERFNYLKLNGYIGDQTFGGKRYLNQILYQTPEWKQIRRKVILRDNGCDLGVPGYDIHSNAQVHHLNPITVQDILERRPCVFDLNNLICTSADTHKSIHYGNWNSISGKELIVRTPNDTCPWK